MMTDYPAKAANIHFGPRGAELGGGKARGAYYRERKPLARSVKGFLLYMVARKQKASCLVSDSIGTFLPPTPRPFARP